MIILDANMILRYLLNDNTKMADEAEKYLDSGNAGVTIEVIAEVVYVLSGVYSMNRRIISDTVKSFLNIVVCRDMQVLEFAIDTYGTHNLDFVDCVLLGYHSVNGFDIATFDKKLLKLIANK